MYLVIGLGNPEEEYSKTRHNMGFDAINKISTQYSVKVNKSKFQGLYEAAIIENQKVILIKPQTYMNLSGNCVKEFVDFYKIPKEENEKFIHEANGKYLMPPTNTSKSIEPCIPRFVPIARNAAPKAIDGIK